MARVQQTFGFTESEESKAKAEERKSRERKFGQAKGFVKWFSERHSEIVRERVIAEPLDDAIRAAKIMLDNIGFADAGGRALQYLRLCRAERKRVKVSHFCLVLWRNLDKLNAETERQRRYERAAHINFLLEQDLRSEPGRYTPDEGKSVKETNRHHRERAKEYSLGELEHLAAQLLEQYGTPDAIPKGVKQRLQKSRQ